MKLENVLFITMFALIIGTAGYVKILGSTDLGIDVEKNGYCKQFGDKWENIQGSNICYHTKDSEQLRKTFTEKEFRDHCPDHKLFSLKFQSDCFKISGSIV